MTTLQLRNQLANSLSPYLQAHKDNPVAWQEWSPETIALARDHGRMIFLSVGYNACHWCHVMERESFSSTEVAQVLNNSFIPIKLDRESRPDLDEVYMNFVTATTGHGGWPLNVFLTPDLKPIFGGTYWPGPATTVPIPASDVDSDDRPLTFLDILHKMSRIWMQDRQKCLDAANDVTRQLQDFASEGSHQSSAAYVDTSVTDEEPEPLDLDLLDDALEHFAAKYDHSSGGFSTAPKFPMPSNLRFLLRLGASISFDSRPSTHTRFGFQAPIPGILGRKSCTTAASMALHTLVLMSRSALRDHLGHGFHRYSVTPDWNLPHFEKMLYDNAELLAVYCDAWALGRNPEILGTIYNLVEYLTSFDSAIVRRDGGWHSSEDADSYPTTIATGEKKEGAYYVWSRKELLTVLGDRDGPVVAQHLGVLPDGNVPAKYDIHDEMLNQNTLYVKHTPSKLAKTFKTREEEIVRIIKSGKKSLAQYRQTNRSKPETDTKVICSWNALAINALARAASTLSTVDAVRAQKCQDAAIAGLAFIKKNMYNPTNNKLTRIYGSTGAAADLAFIDDYANTIKAAIGIYDLTLEFHHLEFAFALQRTLDTQFLDTKSGGYLQAARSDPDHNPLPEQILRLKPGTDNTIPSPNGIIASNLLYLSSYAKSAPQLNHDLTLGDRLRRQARATIDAFAVETLQHPFLYVTLLGTVVMNAIGVHSLVVPDDMTMEEVQRRELRGFSRTIVRGGAGVKSGEVMICSNDGVCRPLKADDLDKEED